MFWMATPKEQIITTTAKEQQIEEQTIKKQKSIKKEEEDELYQLQFGGVGRLYANQQTSSSPESQLSVTQVLDGLKSSRVMIVGLGGVGSWAAEALCRSGVRHLILVDLDDVCISNMNRQLHALTSTVGQFKVHAMARRLKDICIENNNNNHPSIVPVTEFVRPENVKQLLQDYLLTDAGTKTGTDTTITIRDMPLEGYFKMGENNTVESNSNQLENNNHHNDNNDKIKQKNQQQQQSEERQYDNVFVLDAMDNLSAKAALVASCENLGIPIVTCGSAAGRTDATQIHIEDLVRVEGDRLIKRLRYMLRRDYGFASGKYGRRNKKYRPEKRWHISAVVSKEQQQQQQENDDETTTRLACDGPLGTACHVTGTFGFVAASQIIQLILKRKQEEQAETTESTLLPRKGY